MIKDVKNHPEGIFFVPQPGTQWDIWETDRAKTMTLNNLETKAIATINVPFTSSPTNTFNFYFLQSDLADFKLSPGRLPQAELKCE